MELIIDHWKSCSYMKSVFKLNIYKRKLKRLQSDIIHQYMLNKNKIYRKKSVSILLNDFNNQFIDNITNLKN